MSDNIEKQATPHDQLIAEIMDSRVPKNEHGWAAQREIDRLRGELAEARRLLSRASAAMPDRHAEMLMVAIDDFLGRGA